MAYTAYANFSYYTGTYKGNRIQQEYFDGLALRASAYLDYITSGATKTVDPVTDEIKMAMCAVADEMEYFSTKKGVISESVGRVSKSYAANTVAETSFFNAAKPYLLLTGLMKTGAMIGNDYKL